MTIKESAQHIGSQTSYAFAISMALLIGIEWLMPGSVLPFVNIIELLPLSFIVIICLICFKKRTKGLLNTLNILLGIIITIALLASLLTNMPIYGLRTILLSGAITIVVVVWAVSMYTEHV
ncbi:MAG: hypothetical protein P1P90_02435 [Patescibacteria group bacterium]|nr:hypothetical protein [Patescibacteria group bacterium]